MRMVKKIAYFILFLMLIAIGWLLRGALPGEHQSAGADLSRKGGPTGASEFVVETVKQTSQRPVTEYVGYVEAIEDAEIYAQVTGTIQTVHFTEGRMVKKGDLLFTIEQELFQAKVQKAEAAVMQAEANLKSAEADRSYAEQYLKRLKTSDSRGVVGSDLDKAKSEVRRTQAIEQQAKAEIQQAEAERKQADIDLNYTWVRAPIEGKIGRAEVTRGDYVTPGNSLLARIVQVNPVRIRFSISDRDYLDLLKESNHTGLAGLQTTLKLPNGDVFSGSGELDFVDNRMDKQTASLALYFRFANSDGLLIPESFVTVQLDHPGNQKSVVVPQKSIMTDQKGEYVYVLANGNTIEKRYLQLADQIDDNRIVIAGVQEGETVIVQGLHNVRPGVAVEPAPIAAAKPATEDRKL